MNRAFKVIWSKARNCYVVVSELAKNHDDGHVHRSRICPKAAVLAAFFLTASFAFYGGNTVYADNVAIGADKEGKTATAVYDTNNNLTIGNQGTKAQGTKNAGQNNTAIGTDSNTLRTSDKTGEDGEPMDTDKNTQLVTKDGKAAALDYSTESSGSTALGYQSQAEGNNSTAIGNNARISDKPVIYYADADGNKTTSQDDAAWYADNDGKPTKVPQVFRDADNKTTTTPQYIHTYTEKDATTGQTVTKTEITTDANKADKNVDGSLKYNYQKADNLDKLYSVTLYQPSSNSIAAGSKVEADGENAVAVGYKSTAESSAVAIGDNAKAEKDTVAIGKEANASAEGGVALGMGSTANRAGGIAGWDPKTGTTSTVENNVWKSGNGAVSVGNAEGSRQITNVAAGSEDSDAVNVAQLKKSMTHYYSVKTTEATDQAGNNNYLNDGATGNNALAAGVNAKATADNATAVGMNTQANGKNSSAYGYKATAAQDDSVAIGSGATAQSEKAISIGAHAIGTNSIAIGSYKLLNGDTNPATSAGENSIAIGGHTNSNNNVAVGAGSYTYGGNAVTVGGGATGDYATSLGGGSVAGANKASAVGYSATSSGEEATALGANAHAGRNQAVAIGSSTANGNQAVAIGSGAAAGSDSYYDSDSGMTAVGQSSIAHGQGTTALGYSSHAGGTNTTAIGGSNSSGANTVAIGGASTNGSYTVAIGSGATADGGSSIALGNGSNVSGSNSTGVGAGTKASNSGTAVGNGVQAGGYQATAIGVGSNATGSNATAIGGGGAWAANSVAIGSGAGTNTNAVSIGKDSNAWGENGVSLGTGSSATGLNSTAIGGGKAYSDNGIAIGSNAQTNKAIAIGSNSGAWGDSAIAIGENTNAWRVNSIVLGKNSESGADKNVQGFDPTTGKASTDSSATWNSTDEAVSFGRAEEQDADGNVTKAAITRQLNNVAAGTLDTDAVNVAQLKLATTKINMHYYSVHSTETGDGSNYTNDGATGTNAMAVGVKASASGASSVAMGDSAQATAEGGVALGKGSKANTAASDVAGYDVLKGGASDQTSITWHSTSGAVSVGDVAGGLTRRINGVAAGSEDTDAVNVAQLKQVKKALDTVDTKASQHSTVSVGNVKATENNTEVSGGNLKLTRSLNDDKSYNYDVSLNDNVVLGKDGKDGSNGSIGLVGQNGKDGKVTTVITTVGKNGTDGTDGKPGVDGTNITRVVYQDGKDGETGTTTHTFATLDDGLKFMGDTGDVVTRKLNTQLDVTGGQNDKTKLTTLTDKNIGVVSDKEGKLEILLNKNLTGLDSVTTGTVKTGVHSTDDASLTQYDKDGNVIYQKDKDGNFIYEKDAQGNIVKDADGNPVKVTSKDKAGNYTTGLDNKTWNNESYVSGRAATEDQLHQAVSNLIGPSTSGGFGLSANGSEVKKALGTTIAINGDGTYGTDGKETKAGNISTSVKDGAIQVSLNKDLNINSTTMEGKDKDGNKVSNVTNAEGSTITKKDAQGNTTASTTTNAGSLTIKNGDVTTTINENGVSTNKVSVGDKTTIENGSASIGGVTINGNGESDSATNKEHTSTITGLSNKTFDTNNTKQYENSGRAATEAQLKEVYDKASQHTTVTVNGNPTTDGNLKLDTTNNQDGSKNYAISLNNDITLGDKEKSGKLTVKSQNGTKSITTNGEDGTLTFKDGKNEAAMKAAESAKGVDGTTDIKRVAIDNHTVATMDDGMQFAGDSGEALKQKLNSTTNIKGGATGALTDGNIGVVSDGKDTLTVKLAKDIKGLDSVETKTVNAETVNTHTVSIAGDNNHSTITIKQGDVNMGGNTITHVAPGKISKDSTEAVNGSQLWQRDQAINSLGGAVNKLDSRVNRVGAGAAALAALHPLDFDPDDKWDFAAGYGHYKDANAAAIGAYYRPNEDTMFSIGGSFGGGENMVNAGVTWKFGQGNHVSTSRVAMAKEIKDLRENVAKLNDVVNRQSALIDKLTGVNAGTIQDKGNDLFPDVPANHWAYEYVTALHEAGILEGYPDGSFGGDRMMTRYEFAAIVYRAIMAGAASNPALNKDGTLDKLAKEFSSELKYIRIDTITKDKDGKPVIQRVRVVE